MARTETPVLGALILSAAALCMAMPAAAASTKCACQATLVCGADDCSPAGEAGADVKQGCKSVSASVDQSNGALSICAFGDCFKGTAKRVELGGDANLWHGSFRRNDDAQFGPSHVTLFLNSGVGYAQISDESGPLQISLTCPIGE